MARKESRGSEYLYAVGLSYTEHGTKAPEISVKGERLVADDLVKLAKRFGVPVVVKDELAKTLHTLEEGQEINEELFEAVAVVLHEIEKDRE